MHVQSTITHKLSQHNQKRIVNVCAKQLATQSAMYITIHTGHIFKLQFLKPVNLNGLFLFCLLYCFLFLGGVGSRSGDDMMCCSFISTFSCFSLSLIALPLTFIVFMIACMLSIPCSPMIPGPSPTP